MPRRTQDIKANIVLVQEQIDTFIDTPLSPIVELLSEIINVASISEDHKSTEKVLSKIVSILERLPETNDRFYFDAYLILSIADAWSRQFVKCSNMIIPGYRKSWAHEVVQMPHIRTERLVGPVELQTLDMIYFRRGYRGEKPNLLEYAWLFHEMGHYLISRHGKVLFEMLIPILDETVNGLQLRSIADRGVARIRAKETIDEVSNLWNPLSGNSRWSHEIVIDVIGLWSCGPAYLSTFYADHENANPFIVSSDHPPVAIRAYALIECAKKLNWTEYTKPLDLAIKAWESSISHSDHNKYVTLRNKELIGKYLDRSCEYCAALGLPRLYNKDLERISKQEFDFNSDTLTSDLVVKAWLVYQSEGDSAYQAWEEMIFDAILEIAKL
ncbi:MAG: hypothetical protein JNM55_07705 [Anaerolineales bacterium]|nr:hypothetical protein [Anaerolineales bacterium]